MDSQMILLAIPLGLIELALAVVGLVDWTKRKAFRGLPKWGWLAVIVVVGIVGPIVYLTLGRGEDETGSDGRDPR
jgi:hypothetical protein